MEKRRVVITGLGTVNPLGNNTADSWAAAKAGKCGIGPITQFDTTDFKCKLAGEVKGFDPETIVDKKEARKMARFTVLALAAAAEAVADSGLDTEAEAKHRRSPFRHRAYFFLGRAFGRAGLYLPYVLPGPTRQRGLFEKLPVHHV